MRLGMCFVGLLCLAACAGCTREKSTAELINDLKGPQERERLIAVRVLPQRQRDAALVVPALIEALGDKASDIRLSAAIGLGRFGAAATDAIPALQTLQRDRDARIREAAAVALGRIDPSLAPKAPADAASKK